MPKITESTHKIVKRTLILTANDLREILQSRKAQNFLGELPDKYQMDFAVPDSYGMWSPVTFSDDTLRVIISSEEHDEEEIKP